MSLFPASLKSEKWLKIKKNKQCLKNINLRQLMVKVQIKNLQRNQKPGSLS